MYHDVSKAFKIVYTVELTADVYYEDDEMTIEIPKGEYKMTVDEIKVNGEWLRLENVQDAYGRTIQLVDEY